MYLPIRHAVIVPALALAMSAATRGESFTEPAGPAPDKSGFTLFNPTPRELMRDLSPDRPDATESPYTVDAGHAQVELSFIDFTHDDGDEERTNAFTVFDTNFKLGLTNSIDLQLVFGVYGEEHVHVSDAGDETEHGFGDLTLRLKMNLWGNDAGDTAFGLMPFVTIPTGTDLSTDEVEGGLIAMFAWGVADNWGIGLQAEIDAVHDPDDDSYDAEFVHTAVVGFDLAGPVGMFVEYIGVLSSDSGTDYQAYAAAGLTWLVTDDLMFDVGVRFGLTDDADDFNAFTGMTLRF